MVEIGPTLESEVIALSNLPKKEKHTPQEYIEELEAFERYIDRAREMHPYARAAFYELLIDILKDVCSAAAQPPPPQRASSHRKKEEE